MTDDNGRFTLRDLPAGHFTVEARKPGFVRAYAGSKQPGVGPGSAVAVTEGQRVSITVRMTRTAVITGVVRMPTGAPATMVRVQAIRFHVVDGERRIVQSGGAWGLDDHGEYRIYGLAPGDYVIAAAPAIGAIGEVRTMSPDDMQWALQQLSSTSAPTQPTTMPATVTTAGFSPVYFPGTIDASAAATISLKAGEERTGVDVPLQFVPTAKITGAIVDSNGLPAKSIDAKLVPSASFGAVGPGVTIRPAADGSFSISGIAPGKYHLFARAALASTSPPPSATAGPGAPPALSLWALEDLDVNGIDIDGLAVRLQPGMKVSGRVAIDTAGLASGDLSHARVTLSPVQRPGGITVGVGPAQVAPDGTFAFDGIVPGTYRLSASLPGTPGGSTWTLKSSVANERETQDDGLDVVANRDVRDVVVTLTDRPAGIAGSLVDASGRPAPDFFVIAFSTDRRYWTNQSWRVGQTRPASNGTFRIDGLPPGDYYLGAMTDLESSQIYDPLMLEQLQRSSVKISIVAGEKKIQNLRIEGRLRPLPQSKRLLTAGLGPG
jgi:hypothetical protein